MNKVIIVVVFVGLAFMLFLGLLIPSVNPKYFSPIIYGVVVFLIYTGKYTKRAGFVKRVRTR